MGFLTTPTFATMISRGREEVQNGGNPTSIYSASQLADADIFHKDYSDRKNLSSDTWEQYLKARAVKGDDAALDYLLNYYMSEHSAQSARAYESQKNATAYQTLVEDMKKAGLNPYWISSLTAPTYTSSSNHYSGSNFLSARRADETENKNDTSALLRGLGIIISALGLFALFA